MPKAAGDHADRAIRDKLDGISRREKFRIRYYNNDTDFILLEKKSKQAGLGGKQGAETAARELGYENKIFAADMDGGGMGGGMGGGKQSNELPEGVPPGGVLPEGGGGGLPSEHSQK